MFITRRCAVMLSLMGGALAISACAAAAPQELYDARAAYQAASAGPAAEFGPAQLHTARQALMLAERTFEDEGDSASTRDRAYVAVRKAELATVLARIDRTRTRLEEADRQARMAQTGQLHQARGALEEEQQRRMEAEQRAKRAAEQLSKLADVKQDDRGMVITLSGSVLFASDEANLLPAARRRLAEVAQALKEGDPNAQIVVEGHTDGKGSPSYNLELSARRADAVRTFLVSQGVSPERTRAQGLGLTQPVADNRTAEGRANNRRVEIVVQPTTGT
jgi:outer membrane protein OmpA-like peptidoglycan-associated protein